MAHSNRKAHRERRRAAKQAKKAAWAALIGSTQNKKAKGANAKTKFVRPSRILMDVWVKIKGVPTVAKRLVHGGAKCWNIGCKRCSPILRVK